MEVKLKDVIHHYLGCEVWDNYNDKKGILFGVDINTSGMDNVKVLHNVVWDLKYEDIKPILRPLSSMTEEEQFKFNNINSLADNKEQCEANNTAWLLKQGFDLFNLISTSQVINKSSIK